MLLENQLDEYNKIKEAKKQEALDEHYDLIFGGHDEENPLDRIEHLEMVVGSLASGEPYEAIKQDYVDSYYEDLKELSLGDLEAEAMVIQENAGLSSKVIDWDNQRFLDHLYKNDKHEFYKINKLKEIFTEKEHEVSESIEITNSSQAVHVLKECGWEIEDISIQSFNACARPDVLHEWEIHDEENIVVIGNEVLADFLEREDDLELIKKVKTEIESKADNYKVVRALEYMER